VILLATKHTTKTSEAYRYVPALLVQLAMLILLALSGFWLHGRIALPAANEKQRLTYPYYGNGGLSAELAQGKLGQKLSAVQFVD